MCYFLYGHINDEAWDKKFLDICGQHGFVPEGRIDPREMNFKPDTEEGAYFRITGEYCDCGTPIGAAKESQTYTNKRSRAEMQCYVNWLKALTKCKKLKRLRIIKHWASESKIRSLKPDQAICIDDLDAKTLAEFKDNTYYTIAYFKRYDRFGYGENDTGKA
jgi:hypothetical protein